MSGTPRKHPAAENDTKQARLENPSGVLYRRERREYHGPSCPWVKRVKPPNLTTPKPY